MNIVNAKQLGILRHSIGLDDAGRGREYRNYFVAGVVDEPVCRELVDLGLMRIGRPPDGCGQCFHVTDDGKKVARRRLPSQSRFLLEVEALKIRLVHDALLRHDMNRTHAARDLGISREGLMKFVRKHGLPEHECGPRCCRK